MHCFRRTERCFGGYEESSELVCLPLTARAHGKHESTVTRFAGHQARSWKVGTEERDQIVADMIAYAPSEFFCKIESDPGALSFEVAALDAFDIVDACYSFRRCGIDPKVVLQPSLDATSLFMSALPLPNAFQMPVR